MDGFKIQWVDHHSGHGKQTRMLYKLLIVSIVFNMGLIQYLHSLLPRKKSMNDLKYVYHICIY